MKKILLIEILFVSSLMAEQGHTQGIAKDKKDACTTAKQIAWDDYHIFQMNPGCRCENTDTNEWTCEVLFSYMSKKEKSKRP